MQHKLALSKFEYEIELLEVIEMGGLAAAHAERAIKSSFEMVPQLVESFKTEATHWYSYEEVLDFVDTFVLQ